MSPTDQQSRNLEDTFKSLFVRLLEFFFKPAHIPTIVKDSVQSVLVIRQHDQLGDMLCVVPLLAGLRNEFPKAHITLIASPVNYDIMRNNPYLSEIVNYDKEKLLNSLDEISSLLRTLRGKKYDIAIVPVTVSVSVTSDLLALLSGAKIRIGASSLLGKPNPTGFCFTNGVNLDWSNDPHRHQTLRNLDSAVDLHLGETKLVSVIGLTKQEKLLAKEFVQPYRDKYPVLIGFHPGAGKLENQWDAKRFASIANRIARDFNACIVITAGPMDEIPVNEMIKYLQCEYMLILNKPIREVAAIIHELDYFVSNDTGVMHVAGGVETPLLSLFGPTDPLQWSPQGERNMFLASDDRNINSINEDMVYKAICAMIAKKN